MSAHLKEKANRIIASAEADLGKLTRGEKSDLLLDNMPELKDSVAAHALLDEIEGGAS